jgi:hypothetical protein
LLLRNSKLCLATPFSCFCNWLMLAAGVNIIGCGRHDFPVAAASIDLLSVVSVTGACAHVGCPVGGKEVFRFHRHGRSW